MFIIKEKNINFGLESSYLGILSFYFILLGVFLFGRVILYLLVMRVIETIDLSKLLL